MRRLSGLSWSISNRVRQLFRQSHRRSSRQSLTTTPPMASMLEVLEDRTLLATFVVDDDGTGDFLTIQAAIDDSGTMNGDTIQISGGADQIHTEQGIFVNKDLTLLGVGGTQIVVQANAQEGMATDRVFLIATGVIATIDNLTIRHGNAPGVGDFGGGISNMGGMLTVTNSTISNNEAFSGGGGIANTGSGRLDVIASTITGNTSSNAGGGVYNDSLGSMTLTGSTISQNSAISGGGILNTGSGSSLTVSGSIVTGNTANNGAGISNRASGFLTLDASTISQNTANNLGGGLINQNFGIVDVIGDSIFSDNTAGSGGGILNTSSGTVTMIGGSITGNSAGSPSGNGGGVSNSNSASQVTLTNVALMSNTALLNGGGIRNSDGSVTLDGSTLTQNSAGISGGGLSSIGSASVVTVTSSNFDSNTASEDGGGIFNSDGTLDMADSILLQNSAGDAAGGIFNTGLATLTHTVLRQNSAMADGGGIVNIGTITLAGSTLDQNTANQGGGGLFNNTGSVSVTQSTLSANTAIGQGGGIFTTNGGIVDLTESTVSGNSAGQGGGINVGTSDTLNVVNSTISGNSGGTSGGGIENNNQTNVTNSTIVGNTAGSGGGITNAISATVQLNNVIVAGNAGGDLNGDSAFFGTNNIVQDGSDSGTSLVNTLVADPLLGPLQNNGGPTFTHALLPGSPAIEAGEDTVALDPMSNPLDSDQRGRPRFIGTVDIGAFEVGPTSLVVNTLVDENDGINFNGIGLREAIAAIADGGLITFDPSLANGTILLDIALGDLCIDRALTIDGQMNNITIDAQGNSRAFRISDEDDSSFVDVSIAGLTISGGNTTEIGGGIANAENLTLTNVVITGNTAGMGGGIGNVNEAPILLVDSVVTANSASGDGGGIYSDGSVTVLNSTISSNIAAVGGGAYNLPLGILTIQGGSIIDGNSASVVGGGIYNTGSGSSLIVSSSTISNNSSMGNGGGIYNTDFGDVSVTGSQITDNTTGGDGGGIYNTDHGTVSVTLTNLARNSSRTAGGILNIGSGSTVTISESSLTQNNATDLAGGLINLGSGQVFVTSSNVTENTATLGGGGISNGAGSVLNITDSTLSQNAAVRGAGIDNVGTLSVVNSTISGNSAAADGGGLFANGTVTITNATIFGNSAGDGGGGISVSGGTTALNNSIVAGNLGGDITQAVAISGTNNLVQDGSGTGLTNTVIGDPLLSPLRDNGGPTQTHELLAGSPAIDAGNDAAALDVMSNPLTTDQRGQARFVGTVDIGAYELFMTMMIGNLDQETLQEAIDNIGQGGTITIDPALANGTVTLNGGELFVRKSIVIDGETNNVTIDAQGNSRVFNIDDGDGNNQSIVVISGLMIMGGNATGNGGGILNMESLSLNNAMVMGNTTDAGGGGIFNGGTLTIQGGTMVMGNIAIDNTVPPPTLLFGNQTFSLADHGLGLPHGGGGIFNAGVLTISDSFIMNNQALMGQANGGGILNAPNSRLDARNSLIANNRTDGRGGGIQYSGLITDFIDLTIMNNTAGMDGGGVHIESSEVITILGGLIQNNTAAQSGGGIWMSGTSTLAINTSMVSGTTINGNSANGNLAGNGGGGIFNNGGTLSITQGTITSNLANNGMANGGGILSNGGSLTINGGSIQQNTAARMGGGIDSSSSMVSLTSVAIDGNSANMNGGGFHFSGSTATLNGGTILNNQAAQEGGGVWNATGQLIIDTAQIRANTANGTAANQGGGGLFNAGGQVIVQTMSIVSENVALGSGGGIYNEGGTLNVFNSTIAINQASTTTAGNGGGGVFNSNGIVSLTDAIIRNNSAINGMADGGGILSQGGSLQVTRGVVNANTAARMGGGIEFTSSTPLAMTNLTLSDNSAGLDGGGVHLTGASSATIIGGVVQANRAGEEGGGLWNGSGNLTIDNALITQNTASGANTNQGGGGIFNAGGEVTVRNQTIISNNLANGASGSGAGILNTAGGNVTINSSTIMGNTANGTQATDGGGGIFNHSAGATVTITRSTIADNVASGANASGGGILNAIDSSVDVGTSMLTGNFSMNNGGGLSNFGSATLTSSTFNENEADSGGGIWNNAALTLINGTLSGNSALADGGGVFTSSGVVNIFNSTIANNRSELAALNSGMGGGIFHDGSGTVTLTSTLVATNLAGTSNTPDDVSGMVLGSFNLIGVDTGLDGLTDGVDNNQVGSIGDPIDPLLVALANNGGPTLTHELMPDSPAIDRGQNPQGLTSDQRDAPFVREFGGQADIGALEIQPDPDFGNDIIVTAPGPGSTLPVLVTLATTGDDLFEIDPFPGFQGGIRVASGDVNNDGIPDIITAAGPGGGPHVKVIDGKNGTTELMSFFAFNAGFTGGVYVAVGDVNGDHYADIIAAADAGGGPHVRVFSGMDGSELHSFFAYNALFTGGVRVAAGDISGDGNVDIITAAGPGGGPHVRVFDGLTGDQIPGDVGSFFAYDANFLGGVFVAAGKVTADNQVDIITGAGAGGGPHVRVFDGSTGDQVPGAIGSFFAYSAGFFGGVAVAATDVNSDGQADIVTSPGQGGGPHVRVFNAAGTGIEVDVLIDNFPYPITFAGGVFVAASTDVLTTQNLMLASGFSRSGDVGLLTPSDVAPHFEAALQRLAEAGLSDAQIAELSSLAIQITDLEDGILGQSLPGVLRLDSDAAGIGWFLDPTPDDDEEFDFEGVAQIDGPAFGRIDLLTVILHELGHHLGGIDLDDSFHPNHFLTGTFPPSIRRLPTHNQLDSLFSESRFLEELLDPTF